MSSLGLEILEWLQSRGDVKMACDMSTREFGDSIVCNYAGSNWRISLDHCAGNAYPCDPRDNRCED